MIKHILYQVVGKDREGSFSNKRRYNDFSILRNLLIRRWPGCLIP